MAMNIDPLNGGFCGADGFYHGPLGRSLPGVHGLDGNPPRLPNDLQGGYCGIDGRYHHPDGSVTGPMSMNVPLSWELQSIRGMIRFGSSPRRGISEASFAEAARTLGVEVAALKAVAIVETGTQGTFDGNGRPTILFERHKFRKWTAAKYDATHPDLSHPDWGGYGKFSAQYPKLDRAFQLDPAAALKSASWGRFQILGENFKAAGYSSVEEMVLAHMESEDNHLKAVARFIKANPAMLKALQDREWADFARRYNGNGYKKNQYDVKLKNEYDRLKKLESPAVPRAVPAPVSPAAPPPSLPMRPRG